MRLTTLVDKHLIGELWEEYAGRGSGGLSVLQTEESLVFSTTLFYASEASALKCVFDAKINHR